MAEQGFHITSLETILENLVKDIKSRGHSPELPTGLERLDNKIWGLHRGEVCIIGGRPSEGKSALAMQMAHNISDMHKRVVFVSLEMTKEQLMERLFCSLMDIDSWDLRTGKLPEHFEEKLKTFTSLLENKPMRIFDMYGYEYKQIEQIIDALPHPPDALFLDYIQLISPDGGDPREAMVNYLRQMKALAMRRNMAVVICSQLNRTTLAGKSAKPELHHLKQTGALEEVADCVLLTWWKTMEDDPEDAKTDYVIRIAKQRHGPVCDVTVKFLPNRFRFTDSPRDDKF